MFALAVQMNLRSSLLCNQLVHANINVISEEQLLSGDSGDFEADSDEAAISLLHKLDKALGRTDKNGG